MFETGIIDDATSILEMRWFMICLLRVKVKLSLLTLASSPNYLIVMSLENLLILKTKRCIFQRQRNARNVTRYVLLEDNINEIGNINYSF